MYRKWIPTEIISFQLISVSIMQLIILKMKQANKIEPQFCFTKKSKNWHFCTMEPEKATLGKVQAMCSKWPLNWVLCHCFCFLTTLSACAHKATEVLISHVHIQCLHEQRVKVVNAKFSFLKRNYFVERQNSFIVNIKCF